MDVDTPVHSEKGNDQLSTNNNETKPSAANIGREEKVKSSLNVCNGGPLLPKSESGSNPGLLAMKKEPDDQSSFQNGTTLHPVSKLIGKTLEEKKTNLQRIFIFNKLFFVGRTNVIHYLWQITIGICSFVCIIFFVKD